MLNQIPLNIQNPSWYTGGEFGSIVKNKNEIDIRFAFCFPDLYDIGMSHLGMKILYHLLNERTNTWCERVFCPNLDMAKYMRDENLPLYGLESHDPVKNFDFMGFTIQYEMCYTTILNMLSLAQIPFMASERNDNFPILIAGGPCVFNPEPFADFFDIIVIGEGEEVTNKLMDLYISVKKNKKAFLQNAVNIQGVYIPSLQNSVKKAIISDLDNVYYPQSLVIPYSNIVHDRIMLEVMRGCVRGCRFCQAGMIYRPFRQKSPEKLKELAIKLCKTTGYEEISLLSLSTSDYTQIEELTDDLLEYCKPNNISLALPSLRIDNMSEDLLQKLQAIRKSGLTFAPEAGTQRLRNVINKNITEENIMNTCQKAFENGFTNVKLYFMIGLPTETDEDIIGIATLSQKIVDLFYSLPIKKSKGINVSISLATFIPKPFTPFQWEEQISVDETIRKQRLLLNNITSKKINLTWHISKVSVIEGLFARGDRNLSKLLIKAYENGCNLDSWDEHFKYNEWLKVITECEIDLNDYLYRKRDFDEVLPWDFINCGVSKKFLINECKKAYNAQITENCSQKCVGCGVSKKFCGSGDYCV